MDILVNNAGCNRRKPALDVTWDDWNVVLDTNLRGSFFVAQAVARGMVQRGYGRIINIGSVVSRITPPGSSVYTGTKGAVDAITGVLARELGPPGAATIGNAISPNGKVILLTNGYSNLSDDDFSGLSIEAVPWSGLSPTVLAAPGAFASWGG